MHQAPFFSVVTIVRNDADGLVATKKSVQEQTCNSLEWIVIDGNSTDDTRELALSYADAHTTVLSEPDKGIYDAMNKGLHLASGEFVIFLNAGDLFAAPDVLDRVAQVLVQEPADVLYCGSIMDFGVTRVLRKPKPLRYIWHGQPGLHQATVFRRIAHLAYTYDSGFQICGDYDVITRMWAANLVFSSFDHTLSINEFDAASASSRRKLILISEAIRIQRSNLGMNLIVIALSVAYRLLSSAASKALTTLRTMLKRLS